MIKRTLHFSNPAYLSLQQDQLVIDLPHLKVLGEQESKKKVPIEDIGIVLLDHQQITITHACIAALLENNAALITCNHSHLPTGMMLPVDGHDIQSERFRYQIDASQPLKKQLWQQTTQAKILNQAAVLFERGIACDNMLYWAKSVRSGDPDNYEARAAAYYWKNVFPKKVDFFRGRAGDPPNNLLNYGYAILRAIVARGLVCSGLLPTRIRPTKCILCSSLAGFSFACMNNLEERRSGMVAMIADWQSSGKSKKQYCLEKGINEAKFYYWHGKVNAKADTSPKGFIPIEKPLSSAVIEVLYPNGVKLKVENDLTLLSKLIHLY